MTDRVIVAPGQCIDRASGEVVDFQALPISPTEKVTSEDSRWPAAVAQNCGTESHTFIKQTDGTYQPENP
jgi:hypothetical protein